MKRILNTGTLRHSFAFAPLAVVLFSALFTAQSWAATQRAKPVTYIENVEEFNEVIESAGDRLLVFDLYADWCMPCKILGPQLEKVAERNREHASVYKINVDKNPDLAGMFGVRGIPYVVFVKQKTAIHAITGVQSTDVYDSAIQKYRQ